MTSRPRWVWWVLAALVFIVVWLTVPPLLYRHVTGDAQVKAITDTRTALLAGLIGIGAIGTFWLNSRVYKLTEQGHITERYTKAIEQLGWTGLDVRLGGIYALERIAVDSARDHPTIVEVLSAFVREHSNPARRPRRRAAAPSDPPRPTADVQAAVTVLGRLPPGKGVVRAHLSDANLTGADLGWANLTGATFIQAKLTGAILTWADLSGATLTEANLSGAYLGEADLSGAYLIEANLLHADVRWANLSHANLSRANLSHANLHRADLSHAHLYRADLSGATLTEANLSGADLGGADLPGADLGGADLRDASDLTQDQLDSARGNARTLLPEGLQRPSSWAQ